MLYRKSIKPHERENLKTITNVIILAIKLKMTWFSFNAEFVQVYLF